MKNRAGEKSINNFDSEIVITRYKNCKDLDVYFPKYNWTAAGRTYFDFKNGKIKCPYEPRFRGVGYIGEGKYNAEKQYMSHFRKWQSILERCCNFEYKEIHPAYKDCTIHDDWHNFQNFASWYDKNYYEIEGQKMHLDKDILIKGNKTYGPNTCVFVPQCMNSLFTKNDCRRGELPIGVNIDIKSNKYKSECRNNKGVKIYLGLYNTPEEAFEAYKTYKEKLIKNIAEEYKKQMPDKLYQALLNYEVEITD